MFVYKATCTIYEQVVGVGFLDGENWLRGVVSRGLEPLFNQDTLVLVDLTVASFIFTVDA